MLFTNMHLLHYQCNDIAGHNACPATITNYMHNKNMSAAISYNLLKRQMKHKLNPVQNTNGDNSYTNLRDHANNYTTPVYEYLSHKFLFWNQSVETKN